MADVFFSAGQLFKNSRISGNEEPTSPSKELNLAEFKKYLIGIVQDYISGASEVEEKKEAIQNKTAENVSRDGCVDGIGVALDEPQGLNDGKKGDFTYFECRGPGYGCFSRPENCIIGDFPEEDPFANLSDGDEI